MMDGVRRCKQFLQSLDLDELKSIKVKIRRPNIVGSDSPHRIYRGLDDPKNLVIHFRKETSRGIFDREDIVLNQEFSEERCSIKRSGSETKDWEQNNDSRNRNRIRRSTSRKKSPYRKDRSRSNSPIRKRSYSPRRESSRRKSRSRSPSPKPVKKIPGLYIPPKSDYLRYEKRDSRKRSRSPSPGTSTTRKRSISPSYRHASNERKRSSSPPRRSDKRRSRSSSRKQREKSRSPRRDRHYRGGRSRTPLRRHSKSPIGTRKEYRSRRSRSRSRHRDRIVDNEGQGMVPYNMFQDGDYWVTPGFFPPSTYIPRGFLPPPIVYPGAYPRMIMPRMPMRLGPPFRPRMYPPNQRQPSTSRCQTMEEDGNQTQEIPGVNEHNEDQNVNSGVTISEIIVEKDSEKNNK